MYKIIRLNMNSCKNINIIPHKLKMILIEDALILHLYNELIWLYFNYNKEKVIIEILQPGSSTENPSEGKNFSILILLMSLSLHW